MKISHFKVKLRVFPPSNDSSTPLRHSLRRKTPTALVFTMVAGCSNSVIFFQVIWFRIRTWWKAHQNSFYTDYNIFNRYFPSVSLIDSQPSHQSCQQPRTGCWDSKRQTLCLETTHTHCRKTTGGHPVNIVKFYTAERNRVNLII